MYDTYIYVGVWDEKNLANAAPILWSSPSAPDERSSLGFERDCDQNTPNKRGFFRELVSLSKSGGIWLEGDEI